MGFTTDQIRVIAGDPCVFSDATLAIAVSHIRRLPVVEHDMLRLADSLEQVIERRRGDAQMTRAQAINIIDSHYGCPGESHTNLIADVLVMQIIGEMGLNALRDDAVILLAKRQQAEELRRGG